MRQGYFIVVLAHSIHGKLRRVHVPHQMVYLVLALAFFGAVSLFGMVAATVRMTWKVANYNSLRQEMDTLRARYQMLQREAKQKDENLATLQTLASETQIAVGVKRSLEGPRDVAFEAPLVPTYKESLEQYNFLKSANFGRLHRGYVSQFHLNVRPSLWPVMGRVSSPFGGRLNPFSHEGGQFHPGVDLTAGYGTAVRATGDGVVRSTDWSGGYGKLLVVDHGAGIQTYYAHLSRYAVIPGQEVRRGDVVAYSGGTGSVTSPHLHYEVRMGGNPVNPYRYLTDSPLSAVPAAVKHEMPF
jgi:murein DD-endopeptidase MepM/ murein hydrolase activator NlpD